MSKRTILITGCSSGIGFCSAHGMRARGWRVFATARKSCDVDHLAEQGFEAFRLDYADPQSIKACSDKVLTETGGKLDALFNNGAYGQPGAVEDISMAALRTQFETNFFGWHDLTCRILPAMRQTGSGRIVQCSSVLGFIAARFRGAYCATKFALEGLTDALRLELKDTGISVSLIEPGPIESRFVEHALAAFRRHVDIEGSPHREAYVARLQQMEDGGNTTFKLGPETVLKKLIHAAESKRPKTRYYVTVPTYGAVVLKRLLPTRLLDKFAGMGI